MEFCVKELKLNHRYGKTIVSIIYPEHGNLSYVPEALSNPSTTQFPFNFHVLFHVLLPLILHYGTLNLNSEPLTATQEFGGDQRRGLDGFRTGKTVIFRVWVLVVRALGLQM